MNLIVKKHINTQMPVKAFKLVTLLTKTSAATDYAQYTTVFTGPFLWEKVTPDEWQTSPSGPGYHAFKTRGGAYQVLLRLAKGGHLKGPTFIIPCHLRGIVEFGKYNAGSGMGIKGIVGQQMRIKTKDIPKGFTNAETRQHV